jgi:lipopolysaccharide/colanic/teichoic acid biosynthesis glycosyltransferase
MGYSIERTSPFGAAHVFSEPVFARGRLDEDWSTAYYLFRRAASVAFSLAALASFMPVVVLAGFLIRLESRGPFFYRGKRVGKDGKVFRMYKLRTLKHGVESQIGVQLLQEDSVHFTRIGRLVRKTKLDEIPQFYNVLRGDMTIVGPRPVRPIRVKLFLKTIPGYRYVMQVKPGITGLSQVLADYYDPAEKKFTYDLEYIQNRSLMLDLKVVLMTVIRVPIGAARYAAGIVREAVRVVVPGGRTREESGVQEPR